MKTSLFVLLIGCCSGLLVAQPSAIRMFIFGHSLIDHRPPAIPTPSDETTVAHWVYLLAEAAGKSFAAGGQYGFLPQHANLPPISQWGYDLVPPVWESDTEPFSAADISTILMTAGNFMQWQAPDAEYPSDPGISPLSATTNIINWVGLQEEGVRYYIYENWPDMAPFLANGFPPSANELEQYHEETLGGFHQWWLDYQDLLLASLPEENVRMIPVGPVMSGLFTDFIPGQIPAIDLYEDDAPHGRPTLYFLAGLITYMAIYEEEAPTDFVPPALVSSVVREQYTAIADYCWDALLNFNTTEGASRVFFEIPSAIDEMGVKKHFFEVFPNPTKSQLTIQTDMEEYELTLSNLQGKIMLTQMVSSPTHELSLTDLPKGIYFLALKDEMNGAVVTKKIIKQ